MKQFKPLFEETDNADTEFSTVYGDVITFVMALFILLFVLAYNEFQDDTFFKEMRVKFGSRHIEQSERVSTEALLISEINGYIEDQELNDEAQILVDEQKIKILLYPPILFRSGKATLTPEGRKLLAGLGDIVKNLKNPIIVEGHTDNVPINNNEFESNWELSFHRAYSVVKFFIDDFNFSPKNLAGLGYGEFRPLVANDTSENRAKNRRIEINIIRVSRAETQKGITSGTMLNITP